MGFPTLPGGMDKILKVHFDKFRDKGELPPELCNNGECLNLKLFDDVELLKAVTWTLKDLTNPNNFIKWVF